MTALPRIPLYRNVMELMVAEEVEQQLQSISPDLLKYINPAQVIAYALNRLPALYATSEEGWNRQHLKAKQQLKQQVVKAVRQGFAAIQADPLKASTPLKIRGNLQEYSHPENPARSLFRSNYNPNSTRFDRL